MIFNHRYTPPMAELVQFAEQDLLAQSPGYNGDNGTEYFDYEDGGLI